MARLDDSVWVSAAEAARLTGLSVRTLKRMVEEGQLQSKKTPGLHVRVLRADVDKLLRPTGVASASGSSVSSVLVSKREEVESIGLELQAERGRRELANFRAQDAEAERERKETRRSQRLANKRALAGIALERERDTERREREQREAEALRIQVDFERRWIRWAESRLFDWLTFEQRQSVLGMVKETVAAKTPADEDEAVIRDILIDAIARFCAPWDAARRARAKREEVIEHALRGLPWGATDSEKLRAASDARSALAQIPLTAGELEVRAAVAAAVEPISTTIKQREAAEEAKAREKRVREEAQREEKSKVELGEFRKSCRVSEGVARVDSYLTQLYVADEIDSDVYSDSTWRAELRELVRGELEAAMTGDEDETREEAEEIAEQIVDEELD